MLARRDAIEQSPTVAIWNSLCPTPTSTGTVSVPGSARGLQPQAGAALGNWTTRGLRSGFLAGFFERKIHHFLDDSLGGLGSEEFGEQRLGA